MRTASMCLLLLCIFLSLSERVSGGELTLRAKSSGRQVVLSYDDTMAHTYGSKVVVTEFKAFYCPPCKTLHERILNEVHDLSRDLPVTFVHKFARIRPQDETTSKKAYCAQKLGGFLRTSIDTLFWMPTITPEQFLSMTMIDPNLYLACINSQEARTYVLRDFSDVGRAEVTGVPSIFVQGRFKGSPRSVSEMMGWIRAEL